MCLTPKFPQHPPTQTPTTHHPSPPITTLTTTTTTTPPPPPHLPHHHHGPQNPPRPLRPHQRPVLQHCRRPRANSPQLAPPRGPRHLRPHPQARHVRRLGRPAAQGHQAGRGAGAVLDRGGGAAERDGEAVVEHGGDYGAEVSAKGAKGEDGGGEVRRAGLGEI